MKKNKVKSFAEEGLEEIQKEVSEAPQELVAVDYNAAEEVGEMRQVGGLEPVAFFYRTSAPKKATNTPFEILEKGTTITGIYERSFVSGKFSNPTYLLRLENGRLAGLAGSGSLNHAMGRLLEGSKVKITYNGMSPAKSGQWAGSDCHNFTVLGNKLKK
jgi:hypothetical protein